MDRLIREARNEEGYCQAELAKLIHRRQAFLSDMENGKMRPDAETLLLLAYHLNKPITYFLPSNIRARLKPDDLDTEELELIMQFRKIAHAQLQHLAIRQVKLLADTDIENYQEAIRQQIEKLPPQT